MSPPSCGPPLPGAAAGTPGRCGTGSCPGPSGDAAGGKTASRFSSKSHLWEEKGAGHFKTEQAAVLLKLSFNCSTGEKS